VDDGRLQNLRDNFLDHDTNPIERLREAQDCMGVFGEDAWMFIAAEAATNVTSPERWQSNGIRTFWGSLSKVYGPYVCQRCAPGSPNPHHTSLAWIRAVDDGRLHHLHRSFLEQDLIPIERVCEVQELCGDALMLLAKKAEKGESSERWQSKYGSCICCRTRQSHLGEKGTRERIFCTVCLIADSNHTTMPSFYYTIYPTPFMN
jgi:hypothetical protein